MKAGYKQTELGIIPEAWNLMPLAGITDNIMVGIASAATHAYRTKGIPLFRNQNIKPGKLDDSDLLFVAPKYEIAFKNKRLRAGDLVTMRTGYPGVTAVVPAQYENSQSFTTLITRPRPEKADSHYLCYFINSDLGKKFFEQAQIGGAQKNVNAATLRTMTIPLPNIPEQRAIAQALGDADALITALDRLIAKKRDIKQATIRQLLEGKTRLPGFTGKWEVKTFGDIVTKVIGGGTPSRANLAFWGNEIPWVTVKDFTTHSPTETQEYITKLGLNSSASHLIPAGTLITATRIALGKAVVYDVDVAINQDLKALFLKSDINVPFLLYWFENFGKLIEELGSGSTVKGVSLPELKRFTVNVPEHSEQVAIAAVLSDMDAELSALEARRDKTRALKQGMMQELLTGKTRLI